MDDELKLDAIGQIALPADDLDRSVEFYRDQLRMKLLFRFPGLAFFDCDGVRLMLSGGEGARGKAPGTIYFKVPDIQAAFAALQARGVEFVGEPHIIHSAEGYELWMAFFKDPAGNSLAIMDERGALSAGS